MTDTTRMDKANAGDDVGILVNNLFEEGKKLERELANLRSHVVDITLDSSSVHSESKAQQSAASSPSDIMKAMAETFAKRNKVYGDNYLSFGAVMVALHGAAPLCPVTAHEHNVAGLWIQIVSKLTRFANSGCMHVDSVHDLAVYAAMLESVIRNKEKV